MSRVGRVVWVDSTESNQYGLVARVSLRMEDGERKDCFFTGVQPWGYVKESAELPERDWIVDVQPGYESIFDDPLKRVTTTVPQKVNTRSNDDDILTEYVDDTFEADIPFYRKLAVVDGISGYVSIPDEPVEKAGRIEVYNFDSVETDVDYTGEIEPRVMVSDIEVAISDEETFEETRDKGSQPIIAICSYDTYEDEYTIFLYDGHDSLENPSEVRELIKDKWNEAGMLHSMTSLRNSDYYGADMSLKVADNEVDMLNEFVNYMNERSFDNTSGWNWVDFDYNYILSRVKTLDNSDSCDDINRSRMSPFGEINRRRNNDSMQIVGRPAFDMMESFCDKMTRTNWRSSSLDYVSNQELGVGKLDEVDINADWENYPERLLAYNAVDVGLTVALDDANDIHNFFYDIADASSIPVYDTFYEKRLVDGYVMSRRSEEEILPSMEKSESEENAGGYVADPVNGRNQKVGVSDLKSLYPSAMITWNISTETVSTDPDEFDEYVKLPKVPEPKKVQGEIEEEQIEWDWLYCSLEKQGIIPKTVKILFEKRNREKKKRNQCDPGSQEWDKWDRKQGATKVIMNSFYGNAGSKYWRMSNGLLGDAVTSSARYTLWKGRQSIEDMGYEALYGDTDSHFIQLEADTIEEQVKELKRISSKMDDDASSIAQDIGIEGEHPFLVDSDLHGDNHTCMVWEPEKIYKVWMQLGKKKRYAGSILWEEGNYFDEPKYSISGFEYRRSDSMEITAELQKKVIKMILRNDEFAEVSEYIRSIIDEIDEDNEDIRKFALPGSLNKPIEDYPNRQVPRAAEYSNEYLDYEFGEGDDPFVYFVKRTPSGLPKTDVVAFEWHEEFPDGFVLDKESIIERGIKKPISSIIAEVDWKFSELREGREQQTMDLTGSDSNPFA